MILLKADQGEHGPAWSDKKISEAYEIGRTSVYHIRKQYHERGLKGALIRKKPDRIYERCLDGEAEAHLIALTCSEAPEGHGRWTLRLLRDQMIELAYVESVSHETVRTVLKKRTQALVE
jgi:transposase